MTYHTPSGLLPCRPRRGRKHETIPLTGVRLRARIHGSFSHVTVVQSYENREDVPLEAVYVFPLEEGSAVCGFRVTIDGRRLRGKVLPRDEAFDRYDDAMADGHGAFLLDQERPNIFTASVGNVLPGQKVEVELTYLAELPREGDGIRLMIPTTVSPRYVPESRRNFEGMTDGERVNPPVSLEGTPYRLDLQVEADLLSPVRAVESPSHKIRAETEGNTVRVTLAGDEGALDRDFVLLLHPSEPHLPTACAARDAEGDRFVMASFAPEIPVRREPIEVTFVVDCSGSMQGTSIEEARRTLLLCLQSLVEGDRFNVVRFGSTHRRVFDGTVPYGNRTLDKARSAARKMRADLGGTEILRPLREVLQAEVTEGLPRRVVLLTDGQVSNEDAVIALARKHRSTTRIFAFGIGAGSSEYLVRGVARVSRGAAEFVHPGETVEEKVLRHFDRITLAGATELLLRWEGLEVEDVTPAEMPTLAPGEAVHLLGRLVAGTEGKAVLEWNVEGKKVHAEVALREGVPDEHAGEILPLLWARRRIQELEEGDAERSRLGSRQHDRKQDRIEEELVRLGSRYGLLSRATSYVAIEERPEGERATEAAELRRIPVALTRGWGGLEVAPGFQYEHARGRVRSYFVRGGSVSRRPRRGDRTKMMSVFIREPPSPEYTAWERSLPPAAFALLYHRQNADGSWDLSAEVAELCGNPLPTLREAARAAGSDVKAERVLATLLTLHLIRRLPTRLQGTMTSVIRKAEEWIRRATDGRKPPGPHASWEDWAAAYFVGKD